MLEDPNGVKLASTKGNFRKNKYELVDPKDELIGKIEKKRNS